MLEGGCFGGGDSRQRGGPGTRVDGEQRNDKASRAVGLGR